jgi:hypothetical protein
MRCALTRAGEQLRARLPAGAQVLDLEQVAERIAAFLAVREVRVTRDPANARYAKVVILRRDPLADPQPIPWPLTKANPLSLWDAIPVGEDEDGNQVTVTLPERNLLLGGGAWRRQEQRRPAPDRRRRPGPLGGPDPV